MMSGSGGGKDGDGGNPPIVKEVQLSKGKEGNTTTIMLAVRPSQDPQQPQQVSGSGEIKDQAMISPY